MKEYLGSAAFSKAVQCLDLHTGEMVCVKIIKNNKDFFDQSLDEVRTRRPCARVAARRHRVRTSRHALETHSVLAREKKTGGP